MKINFWIYLKKFDMLFCMKKIFFILVIFIFSQAFCLADVLYNSSGSMISGRIEGVTDGLIQIKNNGNLVTLIRKEPSKVYKDSVEARRHLISRQIIKYTGNIIYADNSSVKIICEDAKVVIPRYRVKKIEMYVP